MARSSSPWHALRPVLLAGAAAATWLTLSSTAATADAGTDSTSLLGGVTTSVSSLSHNLAATVSPVPAASATGPVESPGLLQPVVTPVAGLADNLIAAVPVVDQVVPAGTVSEVSAPLVELADTVAAGVAQEVAAPAAEAVPVLEPVLQPVSDLLTGAAPLPVPPLDAVQVDIPTEAVPAPAQDQPAAVEDAPDGMVTAPESDQAVESSSASPAAHNGTSMEPSGAGILAHTAAPQSGVSAMAGSVVEQPLPDPLPLPSQAPAAPASGTGSGGSAGGTSPAAAWFNPFYFDFDRAGSVRADRSPEHAPAPVSFDPGSSPD